MMDLKYKSASFNDYINKVKLISVVLSLYQSQLLYIKVLVTFSSIFDLRI